MTRTIR